ncbi:hypothetical protein B0H14DRAFT_3882864 [Mycena olivaceomarginata]|nr:hypothetical protein B0H14DRAFT_3882864 [Mycena olivaceomarginata]
MRVDGDGDVEMESGDDEDQDADVEEGEGGGGRRGAHEPEQLHPPSLSLPATRALLVERLKPAAILYSRILTGPPGHYLPHIHNGLTPTLATSPTPVPKPDEPLSVINRARKPDAASPFGGHMCLPCHGTNSYSPVRSSRAIRSRVLGGARRAPLPDQAPVFTLIERGARGAALVMFTSHSHKFCAFDTHVPIYTAHGCARPLSPPVAPAPAALVCPSLVIVPVSVRFGIVHRAAPLLLQPCCCARFPSLFALPVQPRVKLRGWWCLPSGGVRWVFEASRRRRLHGEYLPQRSCGSRCGVTALGQAYLAVLNLSYVRPVANTLVEAFVCVRP